MLSLFPWEQWLWLKKGIRSRKKHRLHYMRVLPDPSIGIFWDRVGTELQKADIFLGKRGAPESRIFTQELRRDNILPGITCKNQRQSQKPRAISGRKWCFMGWVERSSSDPPIPWGLCVLLPGMLTLHRADSSTKNSRGKGNVASWSCLAARCPTSHSFTPLPQKGTGRKEDEKSHGTR